MDVRDIHVYFCVYLHMFQGSLSMFISQLFVLISYSTSWLLRLWQSGCNSANNNNHISIFFVHQFAVYPHPQSGECGRYTTIRSTTTVVETMRRIRAAAAATAPAVVAAAGVILRRRVMRFQNGNDGNCMRFLILGLTPMRRLC